MHQNAFIEGDVHCLKTAACIMPPAFHINAVKSRTFMCVICIFTCMCVCFCCVRACKRACVRAYMRARLSTGTEVSYVFVFAFGKKIDTLY